MGKMNFPIDTNKVLATIKNAGLKLTKQRKELVYLLYGKGHQHISAEILHSEALEQGIKISLATVYNTLRYLYKMGLINEIKTSSNSVFDTNFHNHAHLLDENTGNIKDIFIDEDYITKIKENFQYPEEIRSIEIILKVKSK